MITFNYESGISTCDIEYKGQHFIGKAICHNDDLDFESERTGLCIAEARAQIKLLKFKRNYELKPQITAITHLLNTMERSNKCNINSYEIKMTRRQLYILTKQLTTINNDIAGEEQSLKDYISKKEKLYQRLRGRNK